MSCQWAAYSSGTSSCSAGEIDLLALDEIHEPREIGREIGGLRRRGHERDAGEIVFGDARSPARPAPGEDEAHQREPPRQRADGRRPGRACEIVLGAAFGGEDQRRVFVGIAERVDAGKQ